MDTLGRGVKTSGEAVYEPLEGYPTRAEREKGRRASSVDELEQLKRDVAVREAGFNVRGAATALMTSSPPPLG